MVQDAQVGESPLTGFDPVVDMDCISSDMGPFSAAQASIVAGALVPAGNAALQAVRRLQLMVNLPIVVKVDVGGAQLSPGVVAGFELVGFSLSMEDPSILWSCNTSHPPFASCFIGDVVELVLILPGLFGVKSSEFVCRPVSLPC